MSNPSVGSGWSITDEEKFETLQGNINSAIEELKKSGSTSLYNPGYKTSETSGYNGCLPCADGYKLLYYLPVYNSYVCICYK